MKTSSEKICEALLKEMRKLKLSFIRCRKPCGWEGERVREERQARKTGQRGQMQGAVPGCVSFEAIAHKSDMSGSHLGTKDSYATENARRDLQHQQILNL